MSSIGDGSRKTGHKVGSNKGIARRRKEVRREEAEARAADRANLSDEEKNLLIIKRPGNSQRESERLKIRAKAELSKTKKKRKVK
jgi:hypothetical protein